jgi:stalled ribosome alternative rescue factor ArfA
MPDYRHKLDKKTANRHFPNWDHGGKGSHARKTTVESRAQYSANWDKIFGKDKHHGNNSST